jgi:prepilin-type N-terminal cleavage/methylation domain-containing protein/prepilin-type processing-associated H-X9-DG protein
MLAANRMNLKKIPSRRLALGFTLIEVLIVIAIIGILAVLLISSLKSLLLMGKGAQCMANLRQTGVLVQTYRADHGGKLPSSGLGNIGSFWEVLETEGYVSEELRCPLANQEDLKHWGFRYAINNNIQQYYPTLLWNQSKAPLSRVVLLAEDFFFWFNSYSAFENTMYGLGGGGFTNKQSHNGGLNFMFADSHIELVRPGKKDGWATTPYPMEDGTGQGLFYHARPSPWYGDGKEIPN